jgi:manganese/zinc/iron transport system substrate-binding protein
VVTTTQIRDLVEQITANRFDITAMMGPGVDPHTYKPTSKDILALSKADIIVFHGMMLEGRLSDVLANFKNRGVRTHELTSALSKKQVIFSDKDQLESHPDPHIWFNPTNWSFVASEFTNMISEYDPEGNETYGKNLLTFTKEITGVKNWAIAQINEIPKSQRKLVTSHDAFQYFGKSFGMSVVALQGISTTTEAGLGDRTNLVDFIKRQKIKAIFVESSVNPDAINEIANECNVQVGGKLFSDALGTKNHYVIGPKGKSFSTNTWTGMMIHNVNTIVNALK